MNKLQADELVRDVEMLRYRLESARHSLQLGLADFDDCAGAARVAGEEIAREANVDIRAEGEEEADWVGDLAENAGRMIAGAEHLGRQADQLASIAVQLRILTVGVRR